MAVPNVTVTSALSTGPGTYPVLGSTPLGRSTATTSGGNSIAANRSVIAIARTSDATGSRRPPLAPIPKIPSISRSAPSSAATSAGGSPPLVSDPEFGDPGSGDSESGDSVCASSMIRAPADRAAPIPSRWARSDTVTTRSTDPLPVGQVRHRDHMHLNAAASQQCACMGRIASLHGPHRHRCRRHRPARRHGRRESAHAGHGSPEHTAQPARWPPASSAPRYCRGSACHRWGFRPAARSLQRPGPGPRCGRSA